MGVLIFAFVMAITAALSAGALYVFYNPKIKNKAGPDWMWRLGRADPVRNIIFQSDGSMRRYSRILLTVLLVIIFFFSIFLLLAAWIGTP